MYVCAAVMDYPYGANANMNAASLPPNFRPGVLDIHGAPRLRTWTKLNSTAMAGSSVIVLAEAVDWQPGDHIVIATSEQDMSQNEEVVVGSVLGPTSLVLSQPLRYTHRAVWYTFEGRAVDLRAEVRVRAVD